MADRTGTYGRCRRCGAIFAGIRYWQQLCSASCREAEKREIWTIGRKALEDLRKQEVQGGRTGR